MGAKRSWWQQINQHPLATVLLALFAVVIVLFIYWGYKFHWDWTGFNSPSKTLWDWLQLLGVLAIPVVVGFGVAWFTIRQGKVADAENKDNQREAALQDYINKMSELQLEKNLRNSAEEDEVRNIARIRTLMVLHRLDPERKRSVVQFLYEAGLIDKDRCIISLNGADLSEAWLSKADLEGADLRGANLRWADLRCARLSDADLSGATLFDARLSGARLSGATLFDATLIGTDLEGTDLEGADLHEAYLFHAKEINIEELEKQTVLLKGATMPDGSIHP